MFDYGICVSKCPEKAGDRFECKSTQKVASCGTANHGTNEFGKYCIPEYSTLPEEAKENYSEIKDYIMSTPVGSYLHDLYESRQVILICAGLAFFFAFAYVKFMDWCAYGLAWLSVIMI